MRDECLNEHLFFSMNHARAVVAGWVEDFNTARPHSAIGYMTPAAYAATLGPQRAPALRATRPKGMAVLRVGSRRPARCHHLFPDRHRQAQRCRSASLACRCACTHCRAPRPQPRRAAALELAAQARCNRGLKVHINKIHAVQTITLVARELGEDEH